MSAVDPRIISLMEQVVSWLVTGDFKSVEDRSKGVRLSAPLLEQAIHDYGRTLISPPLGAFEDMNIVPVANAHYPTWSVNFCLWTKEEGESDLTIECTIIDSGNDGLIIEIDNIHVL